MAALDTIRDSLATALETIPTLSGYARTPGQLNAPAAIVAPDGVEYDATYEGSATYRLPVQVIVPLGDWLTAQRQLDGFVSHDGTVPVAINDASVEARAVGMSDYAITQYAGVDYLGAVVTVEVLT